MKTSPRRAYTLQACRHSVGVKQPVPALAALEWPLDTRTGEAQLLRARANPSHNNQSTSLRRQPPRSQKRLVKNSVPLITDDTAAFP